MKTKIFWIGTRVSRKEKEWIKKKSLELELDVSKYLREAALHYETGSTK